MNQANQARHGGHHSISDSPLFNRSEAGWCDTKRQREAIIHKRRAKQQLDAGDVVQLLRLKVKRMGSQSAFARAAGVDRATVCKILQGQAPLLRKNPSPEKEAAQKYPIPWSPSNAP
jgi:hypothetical protein